MVVIRLLMVVFRQFSVVLNDFKAIAQTFSKLFVIPWELLRCLEQACRIFYSTRFCKLL
jgi:hypothetical protein